MNGLRDDKKNAKTGLETRSDGGASELTECMRGPGTSFWRVRALRCFLVSSPEYTHFCV